MLAPNSWKPIHSGARLTIEVPMLFHLFSKSNINIWHQRLGHASVETLRILDSIEILMTATFALNKNANTPSSQEGKSALNNFLSESTQMSWIFLSRVTGEKTLSPFHRRDVKKGFYQNMDIPI